MGAQNRKEGPLLRTFSFQDTGGTAKTIAYGIGLIEEMLPLANKVTRQPVPASHITVGLQCGGSDGYSGITANPSLGAAVDLLVRHGGRQSLRRRPRSTVPNTSRAAARRSWRKAVSRIKWWEEYTTREKGEMNNNPRRQQGR
jgi:altronate hydrolase